MTTTTTHGLWKNNPKSKDVITFPLKSKDAHSCMLPTAHVKAMVKAMESTGMFTIDADWDDAETVSAYHTESKREAYAAIHKGNGYWIIRHHKQLFS